MELWSHKLRERIIGTSTTSTYSGPRKSLKRLHGQMKRYHGEVNSRNEVWCKKRKTENNSNKPSSSIKAPIELETDRTVLQRRQKQIDYGKNTVGYYNYTQQIPLEQRTKRHPRTPEKYAKYSRRAWDSLIKVWRIRLHEYDPSPTTQPLSEESSENRFRELSNLKSESLSTQSTEESFGNFPNVKSEPLSAEAEESFASFPNVKSEPLCAQSAEDSFGNFLYVKSEPLFAQSAEEFRKFSKF